MKNMLFVALISLAVLGVIPDSAMAQGMMGGTNRSVIKADGHTAREEAEGKVISEALRANETTCEKLSDDDFGSLGEYYMGTMLGDSHEAMNTMMERMMGEEGEEGAEDPWASNEAAADEPVVTKEENGSQP